MYEHRNWDVGSQKRKKKEKRKKKGMWELMGSPLSHIYIYIYEPPLLKDITFAALQGP